jgi:hypothetical protein
MKLDKQILLKVDQELIDAVQQAYINYLINNNYITRSQFIRQLIMNGSKQVKEKKWNKM